MTSYPSNDFVLMRIINILGIQSTDNGHSGGTPPENVPNAGRREGSLVKPMCPNFGCPK